MRVCVRAHARSCARVCVRTGTCDGVRAVACICLCGYACTRACALGCVRVRSFVNDGVQHSTAHPPTHVQSALKKSDPKSALRASTSKKEVCKFLRVYLYVQTCARSVFVHGCASVFSCQCQQHPHARSHTHTLAHTHSTTADRSTHTRARARSLSHAHAFVPLDRSAAPDLCVWHLRRFVWNHHHLPRDVHRHPGLRRRRLGVCIP